MNPPAKTEYVTHEDCRDKHGSTKWILGGFGAAAILIATFVFFVLGVASDNSTSINTNSNELRRLEGRIETEAEGSKTRDDAQTQRVGDVLKGIDEIRQDVKTLLKQTK